MKKLTLIVLLLITVFHFHSCRKINGGNEDLVSEGDLIPVVFSGTEITKTTVTTSPNVAALVLGSLKMNDWDTLYTSVNRDYSTHETGNMATAFGKIIFTEGVADGFIPAVYYPTIKNDDGSYPKVYFKAIAPFDRIKNDDKGKVLITKDGTTVTFTGLAHEDQKGEVDIIATKKIVDDGPQGVGSATLGSNPVPLGFEHLGSKLIVRIKAQSDKVVENWQSLASVSFNQMYDELDYDFNKHELTPTLPSELIPFDLLDVSFYIPGIIDFVPIGEVIVCPRTTSWTITITSTNSEVMEDRTTQPITTPLEKGKEYTVNLLLNSSTGISISGDVAVLPWNDKNMNEEVKDQITIK